MTNIGIHICDISDPCEDSKYAAYLIHVRSPDMPHIWTPDMWQVDFGLLPSFSDLTAVRCC